MPYKVSIPDVCSRRGCGIQETAELVAWATKMPIENVRIPTPAEPQMRYFAPSGEIAAEAEWYVDNLSIVGKGAKSE